MSNLIYQIRNVGNGKSYVGSTVNFERRKKEHLGKLNRGIHHSCKLQNAWNKYGSQSFVFQILEECGLDDLIEREQYWIDTINSYYFGYNSRPRAESNRGCVTSLQTRKKLSDAGKGKKKPAGFGSKIAENNRKRTISEETKEKIKRSRLGKPLSQEHKEAIRQNSKCPFKGRTHTDETKQKIKEARKKQVITKEHSAKVAEANRGKIRSDEQRRRISDSLKGHACSEETKRKISEAKKKQKP